VLIQVVGSKPGAKLLKTVDLHLFVNGACHLMHPESHIEASAITGQNIMHPNGVIARHMVYDSLKKKNFNQLFLISFQNETFDKDTLKKIPCDYVKVTQIKRIEKAKLELSYIENIFRFIINIFSVPGPRLKSKIVLSKYVLKNKELKLSTGLFSVIYLLDKFPSSKIIVTGIGFGKSEYWWGKENKLRGHFLNDYAFLSSIPKKHEFWQRVMTTESELTDLFGIKPYFQN
jgi:hypothetical protein